MSGQSDRWIRWTTTGCVALLALIAGTVEPHGQPGWVAALSLFSVDGMIVAASTTLLADSRSGGRGGFLPWVLLVAGSMASLATNVAVAQPTAIGRVIAAWPSFALIAAYEMLMRQVRRSAAAPLQAAAQKARAADLPPGRARRKRATSAAASSPMRTGDRQWCELAASGIRITSMPATSGHRSSGIGHERA